MSNFVAFLSFNMIISKTNLLSNLYALKKSLILKQHSEYGYTITKVKKSLFANYLPSQYYLNTRKLQACKDMNINTSLNLNEKQTNTNRFNT